MDLDDAVVRRTCVNCKAEHKTNNVDPDYLCYSCKHKGIILHPCSVCGHGVPAHTTCNGITCPVCIEKKHNKSAASDATSPKHYTRLTPEPLEVIEAWDGKVPVCLLMALKYLARAGHKGSKKQDLKKAIWLIERELMNCGLTEDEL